MLLSRDLASALGAIQRVLDQIEWTDPESPHHVRLALAYRHVRETLLEQRRLEARGDTLR